MNKSNGKIWPYAISISIILVFFAAIATIVVATKLPVEKSDNYMMGYQEADAKANELIKSQIAFDKKYKIKYKQIDLSLNNSTISYTVLDKNSQVVNDAKIKIIITRPNNHKNDQEFTNPTIKDGIYSFNSLTLPLEGRWDIMAKVTVGDVERFYNVKADTRDKKVTEY